MNMGGRHATVLSSGIGDGRSKAAEMDWSRDAKALDTRPAKSAGEAREGRHSPAVGKMTTKARNHIPRVWIGGRRGEGMC